MQKEAVQELLSGKLIDVNFNQENEILYGKYAYNQLTIGNYFIDYGSKGLDFDLREYQEKFIANEYYKIPGHLQWNYYLIFLREKYEEAEKLRIEKDDIFTRKYVFTPSELKEYFNYQKSEKSVDTDVINTWKEKLKAVDLDEAYSETAYTQAIPRFLSKEVIKDNQVEQVLTGSNQDLVIKKISTLQLKTNYRKFPLTREFALGKVNLFKGVNGSGKTSLLESIELIITGKSNRDPQFSEQNNCIEATYNDDVKLKDSCAPNDNAKYRERDIAWYSSAYKTGNDLYRTFNRYNFYDSDAAYNLSYKSDLNTLSKFLSSIALGPEFNRIQTRLKGFQERLSKELSVRKRSIQDESGRHNAAKVTLDQIKSASNPEEIFKTFKAFAIECKWKSEIPKKHDDPFVPFEQAYQLSQSLINSLNQILVTIKLRSATALKLELDKIEKALSHCKLNKDKIDIIKKAVKTNEDLLNGYNENLKLLNPASKYFLDEQSFNLPNLSGKLESLSFDIKKSKRTIEEEAKITDKAIFQVEQKIVDYKNEQLKQHEELTAKQQQLKSQITKLKSNLDKLQNIVSEIKSSGKQYITLNPDANACPLCETEYPFRDLSDRISIIASEIKENVAIDELNKQLLSTESELTKVSAAITCIGLIEGSISNVYSESEYSQLSLVKIGDTLKTVKDNLATKETEHAGLSKIQQELNDRGFSELQFIEVKENIEAAFPDLKFDYKSKQLYDEIISKFKKNAGDVETEIKKSKSTLIELDDLQKKIISEVAPTVNYLDFDSELTYRIDLVKKGLSYFEQLNSIVDASGNEDISDTDLKLTKLYKIYEEIKKAVTDQKELHLANQIIAAANTKIKELEPECTRIQKGLDVINDILTNHNESSVLGNFIESNESEIQEIFQNIHTPHEFSKIIFSVEQNTVLLKRRLDDSEVPMNKISTGQRSALALSIFIALNKKLKHGPYVMLFDDPVTYTDDLNILSFLDYLRELVLNENRQLFFATANQKLAGLFEKKFAFLDGEFKTFQFERQQVV